MPERTKEVIEENLVEKYPHLAVPKHVQHPETYSPCLVNPL
jgi:hypothetical protein